MVLPDEASHINKYRSLRSARDDINFYNLNFFFIHNKMLMPIIHKLNADDKTETIKGFFV
jgi:hypothetical protein